MSEVPKARSMIEEILEENDLPQNVRRKLRRVLGLLVRESPIKRAPIENRMTEVKKQNVRRVYEAHPNWSHEKIGRVCGVNIGRVSEVIRGKI